MKIVIACLMLLGFLFETHLIYYSSIKYSGFNIITEFPKKNIFKSAKYKKNSGPKITLNCY